MATKAIKECERGARHVKGSEHAMWVIVAIIIALVVASVLIYTFGGISEKVGGQTIGASDSGADALKVEMCKAECDTCLKIYGTCDDTTWGVDGHLGKNCAVIRPVCE